jgi:hypothetical protein
MSPCTSRAILTALLGTFLAVGVNPLVVQAGGTTALPVYPGAVASALPEGVGLKRPPPPQAKTYATSDSFAKVKAWYQAHLNGAQELPEPGMEKIEDAFLVGNFQSGMVVMIESYKGKTWIIIGPAA